MQCPWPDLCPNHCVTLHGVERKRTCDFLDSQGRASFRIWAQRGCRLQPMSCMVLCVSAVCPVDCLYKRIRLQIALQLEPGDDSGESPHWALNRCLRDGRRLTMRRLTRQATANLSVSSLYACSSNLSRSVKLTPAWALETLATAQQALWTAARHLQAAI